MAEPIRADEKTYLGDEGRPTDDVSAYGGDIDLGAEVDENTVGNLFGDIRITETTEEYFTAFYKRLEHTAPGTLTNARVANRAGARLNTSSGTASVVSTSNSDTGQVKVIGTISGNWDSETLTLNGTTTVIGSKVWDNGSVIRWEHLGGVPVGLITCGVNSYVCGVIWGTSLDPADGGPSIATYMASAEIDFALATAKNATITGTNRLTAPASGIGSFSKAVKWSGNDTSIAVPTGDLEADEYIGICVRFTAYGNVPAPVSGKIQFKHNLIGDSIGT